MTEKMKKGIILEVHRTPKPGGERKGVIRIDSNAEEILRQLSVETGLSVKYIASSIIIQGADMVEIVEV